MLLINSLGTATNCQRSRGFNSIACKSITAMTKGHGQDSKLLDRAFNKAFSVHNEAEQQAQPRVKTTQDKDAELRELTTSMDISDAVSRMLLAQRDGDYFRCHCPGSPYYTLPFVSANSLCPEGTTSARAGFRKACLAQRKSSCVQVRRPVPARPQLISGEDGLLQVAGAACTRGRRSWEASVDLHAWRRFQGISTPVSDGAP